MVHVDFDRAAEGPFVATIAHRYLTLSLRVPMLYEVLPQDSAMPVSYTGRAASAFRHPFRPLAGYA